MERKLLAKPSGDPLTRARLSWLESCATAPGGTTLELKLAIHLALRYAGLRKSRAQFDKRGCPVAWPPQARLAEELGCTRQAIAKAAGRLARRGLLEVHPGLGRGRSTEYALIVKGNRADCLLAVDKGQRADPEKATNTLVKSNQDSKKKATSSVAPFPLSKPNKHFHSHSNVDETVFQDRKREKKHPEFEKVFAMWPNPDRDHGMALACWINAVVKEGVDPVRVRKRARRWCRHWEATGEKRIPYLGFWLKNSMWEDAPDDFEWRAAEKFQTRLSDQPAPSRWHTGEGWEID